MYLRAVQVLQAGLDQYLAEGSKVVLREAEYVYECQQRLEAEAINKNDTLYANLMAEMVAVKQNALSKLEAALELIDLESTQQPSPEAWARLMKMPMHILAKASFPTCFFASFFAKQIGRRLKLRICFVTGVTVPIRLFCGAPWR